jgi:hypothetical protein
MGCVFVRTCCWATTSHADHINHVENMLYARNRPVLKVGDSAKAQKRISQDGFPYLFVIEDWSRRRFHYDGVLRVVADKISGRWEP